jgi:hypothetical protein
MRAKKLTIAEVEYVAFTLTRKLMTYNEPIPDFGTRFPNILESCLETPFIRFSKKRSLSRIYRQSKYFILSTHQKSSFSEREQKNCHNEPFIFSYEERKMASYARIGSV